MSAAIMLFILTLILFVRGGGGSLSADTDLSADTRLRRPGGYELICCYCRGRDSFYGHTAHEEGSPPRRFRF